MAMTEDRRGQRSLLDLIAGLAHDTTNLFRKEIELAKAEASEKVSGAMGGATSIAIGGVLALGALGVLLAAVVTALGAWIESMGVDPIVANSISAAIVGVLVALIAWAMIAAGIRKVKENDLNFDRTTRSIKRDAEVVRESF